MLEINNLKVNIDNNNILKGVDLVVEDSQVHALMGPNGSGKSTLAQALMGHPSYEITDGSVSLNGKDVLDMEPDARALEGIFLSFQYPSEISGVTVSNFLRMIYNKHHTDQVTPAKFRKILKEKMDILQMDESFVDRYLNEGYSGGEKKRMEMLQMLIAEPKIAILDETDSGLDIDALKTVSEAVNLLRHQNGMSVLIITHYTRILKYIEPDRVHIMRDGKIIKEGGKALAHQLEEQGYAPFGE